MKGIERTKIKRNSYRKQMKKAGQTVILKQHEYSLFLLNPQGFECKKIQKNDHCFCGHPYQQHKMDDNNKIHCGSLGCTCKGFQYIPNISYKCLCKHSYLSHTEENKKCSKCSHCLGFITNTYCKCGYRLNQHNNQINYKENKENLGKICSLPQLIKSKYDRIPEGGDKILEKLSYSMIQKDIRHQEVQQQVHLSQQEQIRQSYLKQKLKLVNKRYYEKFHTLNQSHQVQQIQEKRQQNAYDLYLQPHFYREISLTKLNSINFYSK